MFLLLQPQRFCDIGLAHVESGLYCPVGDVLQELFQTGETSIEADGLSTDLKITVDSNFYLNGYCDSDVEVLRRLVALFCELPVMVRGSTVLSRITQSSVERFVQRYRMISVGQLLRFIESRCPAKATPLPPSTRKTIELWHRMASSRALPQGEDLELRIALTPNLVTPCTKVEFKGTEADRRAYYTVIKSDRNQRIVLPEPGSEEHGAVLRSSLEDLLATDTKGWPRFIVVTKPS